MVLPVLKSCATFSALCTVRRVPKPRKTILSPEASASVITLMIPLTAYIACDVVRLVDSVNCLAISCLFIICLFYGLTFFVSVGYEVIVVV